MEKMLQGRHSVRNRPPRGWLAVVRANPGNAAQGLGVSSGDLIWIRDGS